MLLGIDATNWIHQIWHAQHGIGVLATVAARIEALADSLCATRTVACLDARSFRHDLFPGYKAKRPPKALGLADVLEAAPAELAGVAEVAQREGFEADDALATLARIGLQRNERVALATGDKDVRQCLVHGHVEQVRRLALQDGCVSWREWYTAETLWDELRLVPAQWTTYQALCGDSGDGIPGCPGWGAQTTLAVLREYETLEEIYRHVLGLRITPRQRNALLAFRRDAELMLRLVTLRTDFPGIEALFEPASPRLCG